MPKRAAACRDFKHKSIHVREPKLEIKRVRVVEDKSEAISLTTGENHPQPNRRLTYFVFYDEDGKPRPVEMLEVIDIFITGLILSLKETNEKDKVQGGRCERFHISAHACIDIDQKLSRSCGGDPNQSLEELLAKVVRSMSGRNNFPRGMSVRDFIVSQEEFIFYELIG
ncbi:hypothetical protein ACSBR1_025344 [Camellia fascicularis]